MDMQNNRETHTEELHVEQPDKADAMDCDVISDIRREEELEEYLEMAVGGTYNSNVEDDVEEDDENCVIKSESCENTVTPENMPKNRRIVDINYIVKKIITTFEEHATKKCQLKDWQLVNLSCRGLLTKLSFKCRVCRRKANFWSESVQSDNIDINRAATTGTITAGIGYYQLQELYAALNIPCMTDKRYVKDRQYIIEILEKVAKEQMKIAGKLERKLALQNNETINGIPYITVIVDGSWAKRSYGTAYDSLSGVGVIIGYRTGKVLFVGIRNKCCIVCDTAERNGVEPKIHKCYKNFDRNAPSTSMESDAIVEGFKCSIEMHGLMYKTVVADGDSSVYQSIIDNAPYREQMVAVNKVECTNHLLRNLCKKLRTVAEITQPKTQRKSGFVQMRNVVKSNVYNIRNEVVKLVARRKDEDQSEHCKIVELQKDILNIASHIFGEHQGCKERGHECIQNCDKSNTNYVPYLKQHDLYQKVQNALIYLSGYSASLLLQLTNNYAESSNALICKGIAGKRINFCMRGAYNARVYAAVIQYNTRQVLTEVLSSTMKNVSPIVQNMEKERQARVARTRIYKEMEGKTKKFKRQAKTDCHYGPQSKKPDLAPEVYEVLRQHHLEKLRENGEKWKEIECLTRDQVESDLWHSLRREMLTASNFGLVCRMRQTTSCAATVKNILFPIYTNTAAMKYGRDREEIARKELALQLNKDIKKCGLFIDSNNPCLGASPDGLIDEDGSVEIKCRLSAEHLSAEEAIQTLPQLKSILDKKQREKMNINHRFFYQIQGQLNIAQRDYCIFALWTPKSIKTVRVNRDIVFWQNKMVPLLTRFYEHCMLPEILDSRHNRHMPIRNPEYILKAKEDATKKKSQSIATQGATDKPALDTCSDNDCILVSTSTDLLTEEDKARQKEMLDETIAPLSVVKENVLPVDSKLNDESLDSFLRVVRDTTCFETESVLYIEYPHIIVRSCSDKSLLIIGGNCTDHWRCVFFDGCKLHVYDSLPGCAYDKLAAKEKKYLRLRYPHVKKEDIMFEKVQTQPDYTCCGIYAAAFATSIALGKNPCEEKYSTDVRSMRRHFFSIIERNALSPFPQCND